ncbi:hypothetical protein ABT009_32705 [Streptomyces sp. NPDC002896]|uniref:hypothetical protein n=1 Tax=Streptomyces sp. NPDC002896 TaxID=3154438 RepID=UPI003333B9B3
MHRDKGKPTVYVTHDQTEAFAMGDRVAVIARGQVQQIGPATELAENPANMFVASFIGSPPMNLLPGRIRENGPIFSVEIEDTLVELPEHWRASLAGLEGGQGWSDRRRDRSGSAPATDSRARSPTSRR